MTCAKVIRGNLSESYDSECLYQGELLQLDDNLQYVRHARMFVMREKICLAPLDDEHEDCSHNNCLEISRSCVNIDFVKNSPYTFKLNVDNESNVYQLCNGHDSWPEFLRSFDLEDITCGEDSRGRTRVLAKVTFDDMDDYISDSESECSSLSDGSSGDDIGSPQCFSLCVGQGLGTVSMYGVNNAMMMMNPGHVRRLKRDSTSRRASIDFLGLPSSDSDESLRHANSYPQLSYNTKADQYRSLPNLTELDNVPLDEDLKYGSLPRRRSGRFTTKTHRRTYVEKSTNFLSSVEYRAAYGKRHACSNRELYLNEQIRKLIAQPSSIKFCNTAGRTADKNENKLDIVCENVLTQEHFEPVKTEQPKSKTYEIIDSAGGKFKLSFKKFWKRKEKLNISKTGVKSDASSQQEDSENVVFINKLAVDYRVSSQRSYAVSSDRRGGVTNDVIGKNEHVNITQVTRQRDCTSPTGIQAKEKSKSSPQPTLTGKATIRKKIVKRILSPITILRSVSEEDKNTLHDLPPSPLLDVTSKDADLVQVRPKKLLDMNPLHVAQELCLIDKELFVRIPWTELSTCGWMTKHKFQRSPSVMTMVEFFNRIALLVASEILFEVDPLMRVRVISKVIQVANKLRALGNFNSLKALLGGLQCTPIYRLKETWKEVSSKRKKNLRELSKLMGEENNFAVYRNEVDNLMNQKAPCLIFLGDFLTQIAQSQSYESCRKKKSNVPVAKNESATESDASPTTPIPRSVEKESSTRKTPRTSSVKRRISSNKVKEISFSKSSPNLPASCTRTPERNIRSQRFRRCRSWHQSADSGIQVNTSNNSSLSTSSNSFLTSNTSLGSGTNEGTSRRDHARSSSTSTPISVKNSMKLKLRRNKSVSEKCLSNSDSGSNLKARLSFVRSFRRSKSVDQSPSSAESIQRLYSAKIEKESITGINAKDVKCIPEAEDTELKGTELQLWHYHVAAIQYNFPSRPLARDFLLSTPFNSEEHNYKLSLEREPPARRNTVS